MVKSNKKQQRTALLLAITPLQVFLAVLPFFFDEPGKMVPFQHPGLLVFFCSSLSAFALLFGIFILMKLQKKKTAPYSLVLQLSLLTVQCAILFFMMVKYNCLQNHDFSGQALIIIGYFFVLQLALLGPLQLREHDSMLAKYTFHSSRAWNTARISFLVVTIIVFSSRIGASVYLFAYGNWSGLSRFSLITSTLCLLMLFLSEVWKWISFLPDAPSHEKERF